jgi:phage replication O-like protein O
MQLPNHTQIPNQFLDVVMQDLSGSAVKVFLAICRKTIGWHKVSDAISYSQLKALTGLGNSAVSTALMELERAELIISTGAPGRTNRYDVRFTSLESGEVTSLESGEVTSPESGEDLSENQRGTSPESGETKETSKETRERKPTLTLQKFSFTLQDGFVGVPHEDMARWRETYPAVNIELEIRRAAEWLRSNPSKMKSNYRRFLTNWFSRTQDRGGTAGYRPPRPASEYKPLAPEAPLTDEERAENLRLVGQLGRKLVKKVRPNVRMKETV